MEQINYTQDNELSKRLETIRGAIGETVIFEIGMREANNPEFIKCAKMEVTRCEA